MTQDPTPEAVAEMLKRLRDFYPHEHEFEVVDEAADMLEAFAAENKLLNDQLDAIEEEGTESLNALPDCLMKLAPALVKIDDLTRRHEHALHKIDALEDIIEELEAKLAEMEAERVMSKAAYDSVSSLLLSVQQDCIREHNRAEAAETKLTHMTTAWGKDALRVEELEIEVARLRDALQDAVHAWDNHNKSGDMMQGYWVDDARAALQPKETDHE
jgi:chromosome segregation ATPase